MLKLTLAAVALTFSVSAMAQSLTPEGNFGKHRKVIAKNYSKDNCKKGMGRVLKGKACEFKSIDTVAIKQISSNRYLIDVNTIGNNLRTCSYLGEAEMINPVQMVSVSGECEITVGFQNPNTLAVWNNGKCANVCDQGMDLSVSDVKRAIKRK